MCVVHISSYTHLSVGLCRQLPEQGGGAERHLLVEARA